MELGKDVEALFSDSDVYDTIGAEGQELGSHSGADDTAHVTSTSPWEEVGSNV